MTVQTLDLKHSLQTRLTQKMQQAIKLLQMSNQELSACIATYVESNPLLEMSSLEPAQGAEEHDAAQEESDSQDSPYTDAFENVWQDAFSALKTSSSYDHHTEAYDPFAKLAQEATLKDSLRSQIDTIFHTSADKEIAYMCTDLLNEDGYLIEHWEEEIKSTLHIDSHHLQAVLEKLQTLEPTGVFARSLEECLTLQLKDKGLYHKKIDIFLAALKKNNSSPSELAKTLNISLEQCEAYKSLLKTLNPRPGASSGSSAIQQIIPDVLMYRKGLHEWVIELSTLNLPALYLNSAYYIELRDYMKNRDEKQFLQEKYIEAKWLLKSLHQRAVNILKVTDCIIRKQADFFKRSHGRIQPLTLKDVAIETELSESTVSRVTTDKYIQTPRGLFELKYFFSVGIHTQTSHHVHSAKSAQAAIARIIHQENPEFPLSDGEISERLKLLDIYVARRTIAKYRGILKIENASERLKYYKWAYRDDKILAVHSST